MPSDKQLEAIRKEGRLIAAVNAYKSGQITSIRAGSRLYRVGHETLRQRVNGTPARADTPANNRIFKDFEERILLEWILDLSERGFPPRKWMVRDTANLLLKNRGTINPPVVGKNWVDNFIIRHLEVKIVQSKKYDY